jgi:hypothetical protein
MDARILEIYPVQYVRDVPDAYPNGDLPHPSPTFAAYD